MTTVVVEILLGVSVFNMDRGAELTVVNVDTDVQKSDLGGGNVPGKVDGIASIEPFKESSGGVSPIGPE